MGNLEERFGGAARERGYLRVPFAPSRHGDVVCPLLSKMVAKFLDFSEIGRSAR
jgi:hypothetical protein